MIFRRSVTFSFFIFSKKFLKSLEKLNDQSKSLFKLSESDPGFQKEATKYVLSSHEYLYICYQINEIFNECSAVKKLNKITAGTFLYACSDEKNKKFLIAESFLNEKDFDKLIAFAEEITKNNDN